MGDPQGPLRALKSLQEPPGAAKSLQQLLEAFNNFQELPGPSIGSREAPGGSRELFADISKARGCSARGVYVHCVRAWLKPKHMCL